MIVILKKQKTLAEHTGAKKKGREKANGCANY